VKQGRGQNEKSGNLVSTRGDRAVWQYKRFWDWG
jgi:hypothetical protein